MKKQKKITQGLAAASCALLGVVHQPLAAEPVKLDLLKDWEIKTALLFYSETDRVSAAEPVIQGKKMLDTDESITLKLVLDTLTGASASGAVPTDFVQTFTRPSGGGSYEAKVNETPLDDTFRDTRVAVSGAWDQPLANNNRLVLSGNISKEYDYFSISSSALFSHDMNQKNTTLSGGLSLAFDTISPEGGIPTAFSEMAGEGAGKIEVDDDEEIEFEDEDDDDRKHLAGSDDTKIITDLLLGVTQVIDRNSLMQINYSLSLANGYQTDPFKVLSVVQDSDGRPEVQASGVSRVLYEKRPDKRQKQSLYGQYKRYFDGDVLDTSYRYLWDDWGLNSHTVDVRYRFQTGTKTYWQPHVRYYQQSAVDFYEPYLLKSDVDADVLPEYATADYRLGDFDAYTLGLEYGYKSWAFAAEFYQQTGKEPDNKFGELKNQTLGVDLNAVMFRVNYDF